MTEYPHELQPSTFEIIELPDGKRVEIPKAMPQFQLWVGNQPGDTYGGKAVLNLEGQAFFAELLVLRLLEKAGWSGVWVDSFASRYRHDWPGDTSVDLPAHAESVLNAIQARDIQARCWDVFCWHDAHDFFFAELKRKSRDRIRESQRHWLAAGLEEGFDPQNFLVVEWDIESHEAV